jgi:hypothetical protein
MKSGFPVLLPTHIREWLLVCTDKPTLPINADNPSKSHRNDNQVKFLIDYNKIHRQKSTFCLSGFGHGRALFLRFCSVRRFWFSRLISSQ